jgi:DNA-binding beta-propeller fold protein YncE/pimeloyl-ACP methyl ester carboxylesterase
MKLIFSAIALFLAAEASGQSDKSVISTVAGVGAAGYSGDGGPALSARLDNPFGVVVALDGDIVFCDTNNHVIRSISRENGEIRTLVGTGKAGYLGDGGGPLKAELNEPYEIRYHPSGDLYWVERLSHTVRKLDARTNTVETVAGNGKQGFSGDGGAGDEATLNQPHSIVISRDGSFLLICDIRNQRIRKVDLVTGVIDTWCGNGTKKETPAVAEISRKTPLKGPRALCQGEGNTFYLALREGNQVFRIDQDAGKLYHLAGTGVKGFHAEARSALESELSGPKGIDCSPDFSRVYLADTESHTVRAIDLRETPPTVSLIVGTGKRGDGPDSPDALACSLARLHGVGVDPVNGDLYIGDSETHKVRKVSQDFEGKVEAAKTLGDFKTFVFEVDGRKCRVAAPEEPAPGRPWIWRCRFWGASPSVDVGLLKRGWHVAFIDVSDEFGGPKAMNAFDAFYPIVREQFGLAAKAIMEGFSRGGLPATLWTIDNPEKVSGIYLDAAVMDIHSWPRDKVNRERCMTAWGLNPKNIDSWKGPLDQLKVLVDESIPVMIVAGGDDKVVPYLENTGKLESFLRLNQGKATAIVKAGAGHHPHSLHDPSPVVEWAEALVKP